MTDKLKVGETIAYDKAMIQYQLIPQNFRQFVGQLVLMDDEAVGAETPSWLEVVQLVTYHYNGDVTIMTDEGNKTIPKYKLVKHSGNYVAFYAIKPEFLKELENAPESAVVVSAEYLQAVEADKLIDAGAELVGAGLYQMATGFKQMHDGKLYKQFGFTTFADFCKSKGYSDRNGRRFVKIAEMASEKSDTVSGFEKLGFRKNYLLALFEPEEREEFVQTHDVENMTVKELEQARAEIKRLKAEKEQLEDARRSKHQEWLNAMDEITTLTVQKSKLEEQVQELESRPADMHSEKDAQEIERLTEELDAVTEERDLKEKARLLLLHKWQESKETEKALQKKLDELKAKPPETVTVEDTSRIEELESKIEDLNQQLAEKPAVQESLSSDNGEFDAYFKMFNDALRYMTTYLLRKNQMNFARKQTISLIETNFEKYISALKEKIT